MTNEENVTQLYNLLFLYCEDRQQVIDLVAESGLSLDNVTSSDTLAEFIENVVHEADRQDLVEGLLAIVISEQSNADDHSSTIPEKNTNTDDKYLYSYGDDITIGNVVDSKGIAIGRDAKAIVTNVYNTFSRLTPNILIAIMVAVFLIVVLLFSFVFGNDIASIWRPLKMDGEFNIAIVEFTEIGQNGKASSIKDMNMSKVIFDSLTNSYTDYDDSKQKNILIWHRTSPVVETAGAYHRRKLSSFSEADQLSRCDKAAKLAKSINADMVISGVRYTDTDKTDIVLEFYYEDTEFQQYLNEKNIPLRTIDASLNCFQSANTVSLKTVERSYMYDEIKHQGQFYFWLTLALIEEQQGNVHTALNYFTEVWKRFENTTLVDQRKHNVDFIGYLLGEQYLTKFSNSINSNIDFHLLNQSAKYFQKSLNIKGDYQYLSLGGLGKVWRHIGNIAQDELENAYNKEDELVNLLNTCIDAKNDEFVDLLDIEQIIAQISSRAENVNQAFENSNNCYRRAEEQVASNNDALFILEAKLNRKNILLLQGESFYIVYMDHEACQKLWQGVQNNEQQLLELENSQNYRKLINRYLYLGIAYGQLSTLIKDSKDNNSQCLKPLKSEGYDIYLNEAEEHFTKCIDMSNKKISDKNIDHKIQECQDELDDL